MLTTAFIIALQYFCSERALFAFDRSPRAFWISIAILIPSLLILSIFLHTLDTVKDQLAKKLFKNLEKGTVPSAVPSARLSSYLYNLARGLERTEASSV